MSRGASRGMIQVGGVTYRIERTAQHRYGVVRLLDDVVVGTFRTFPGLRIRPLAVELGLFRNLVRAALRSARTSVVLKAAPVYTADDAEPASSKQSARTPSTMPPRPALA